MSAMGRRLQRVVATQPAPDETQVPGYLPPVLVRPTGTNYVRYEDLVQSGDTITTTTSGAQVTRLFGAGVFQTIINRCPSGKTITFPAGKFIINQPGWAAVSGGNGSGAVRWPKYSAGAVGAKPAPRDLEGLVAAEETYTVFEVLENTAPEQNIAPTWFQAGFSGSVQQHWANIVWRGTEQGDQTPDGTSLNPGPGNDGTSKVIFTNVQLFNTPAGSTMRDCLSVGASGNNGAPPGESFLLQFHGTADSTLCRVHVDGRRTVNGPTYAAAGITIANSIRTTATDCSARYCMGMVFFQTVNCRTYDVFIGDVNDTAPVHITLPRCGSGTLNHERTTGTVHTRLTLETHVNPNRLVEQVHHSNDDWVYTRSGEASVSVANGTLEFIDVRHNASHNSGRLYLDTWIPYWNGNTMQESNPPYIHESDGTAHPYTWVYGGKHIAVG